MLNKAWAWRSLCCSAACLPLLALGLALLGCMTNVITLLCRLICGLLANLHLVKISKLNIFLEQR